MGFLVVLILVIIIGSILSVLKDKNGNPLMKNWAAPSLNTRLDRVEMNTLSIYDDFDTRNIMVAYVFLAGWMMKKSNRHSRDKMKFIQSYFRHYFKHGHNVSREMSSSLRNETDVVEVLYWVKRFMKEKADRMKLVAFLVALCLEDGNVVIDEYAALRYVGEAIGFSQKEIDSEIQAQKDRKQSQQQANQSDSFPRVSRRQLAFSKLELTDPSSLEEIKKSYRRLVKLHHPDKFFQCSLSEQDQAAQRFLEIQAAYEYLILL